mmetsp:Transcript_21028/g.45604  ORF Transcript_21028/g.45604 Transcript_21028/m.45604 type:complete len:201 (+) Transcript_21028:361-963(+)
MAVDHSGLDSAAIPDSPSGTTPLAPSPALVVRPIAPQPVPAPAHALANNSPHAPPTTFAIGPRSHYHHCYLDQLIAALGHFDNIPQCPLLGHCRRVGDLLPNRHCLLVADFQVNSDAVAGVVDSAVAALTMTLQTCRDVATDGAPSAVGNLTQRGHVAGMAVTMSRAAAAVEQSPPYCHYHYCWCHGGEWHRPRQPWHCL